VIREKGADISATFAASMKFKGSAEAPEIDPSESSSSSRARRRAQSTSDLGRRGRGQAQARYAVEQQAALAQSFVVVDALRSSPTTTAWPRRSDGEPSPSSRTLRKPDSGFWSCATAGADKTK